LGTHKIHRLSAHYGKTIYSVIIEGDLRVLFYIEGDIVKTLVVGTMTCIGDLREVWSTPRFKLTSGARFVLPVTCGTAHQGILVLRPATRVIPSLD
jgi:hypothetical protein